MPGVEGVLEVCDLAAEEDDEQMDRQLLQAQDTELLLVTRTAQGKQKEELLLHQARARA